MALAGRPPTRRHVAVAGKSRVLRSAVLRRKRKGVTVAARLEASDAAVVKKIRVAALPKSLPRTRGCLRVRAGPVVGVDEAGRGPWAGPVVAAAVSVAPGARGLQEGITDSKLLAEPQREHMYKKLVANPAVRWTVAVVGHKRIDRINILEASCEAMAKAVRQLAKKGGESPGRVCVDGNRVPSQLADLPCEAVVHGDRKRFVIAAASIIAKVTRDRMMLELHRRHPEYGFDAHKGYGTAQHLAALKQHGVSPVHRLTYKPIKGYLETNRW